jgi:hypothetical protein
MMEEKTLEEMVQEVVEEQLQQDLHLQILAQEILVGQGQQTILQEVV